MTYPFFGHRGSGVTAIAIILFLVMILPASAGASRRLAPLTFFLGSWHCQGKFPDGKTISSRETFTATLDGHWMRMQHQDDPPHTYAAVEWWGYDSASKRFTVDIYANLGGVRHYTSAGWKGNTLKLKNTATQGYIDRFVFRRLGDSRYRVGYAHQGKAGSWIPGDTLTCTRSARRRGA